MSKKNKWQLTGWIALAVGLILVIIYFSNIVSFGKLILSSFKSLAIGAMFAFLLNIIMDPLQKLFAKSRNKVIQKMGSTLALLLAFLFFAVIIIGIITLVVPNLFEASQVLVKTLPKYSEDLKAWLSNLLKDYPDLAANISSSDLNWEELMSKVSSFATKGFGDILDSAVNILMRVGNSFVSLFVIVVFAIYILTEKQRFVRIYHFFTDLYLSKKATERCDCILNTFNETFKAFVTGECIEACILTAMCMAGMLIMQMPYAVMISVLVGVINMIPMVGAFIGGGIGCFLIFTISPIKAIIFLVFLCVIQQIESNIFFPRIVGKNVGLPGIYVMITIVVGGSLFGVLGMLFGVPLVASIYKLLKSFFLREAAAKKAQKEALLAKAKPGEETK